MKTFRAPTPEEITAFLLYYASLINGDLTEAKEQLGEDLDSCIVGVCDDFMPDGPGYCGRVMVIVFSGGAEIVGSYGFNPDGTIERMAETSA